ncbi:hypothetical protein BGX38DRAFT_1149821 [Terfezia claveryi]|nr:hypothetical protein BGX38DRAFT_1149821 [Terfezia claveryi]
MGRSNRVRKNKVKGKTDPLGGVRNLDIGQHSALRETKILPIVKNISSINVNERVQAVTAVANLVEDPTCRKLLLKERIVAALMEQTLNDSSPEVIVRGWGVLRNLAVEEGYDVCLHMYRKDILTPIAAAISKLQGTIRSLINDPASVDNITKKLVWGYAENVVGLVASICGEATEEVVEAVNKLNIFPFLTGLLSPDCKAPRAVQNIAAQCLNVITEEQDELIKSIIDSEDVFVPLILQLRDTPTSSPTDPLLRTVAVCGVAHNISDYLSVSGNTINPFTDSINLTKLTAIIQAASKITPPVNESTLTSGEPVTEGERIEALKDGLEILTSIIASLQDDIDGKIPDEVPVPDSDFMDEDSEEELENGVDKDEDGVDDEFAVDDESMDEAVMLEEMAMVTAVDRDDSEEANDASSECPIAHLIEVVIPLLLPLCAPQDHSSNSLAIQTRAINCLSNISWTSSTALPKLSPLFQSFQKHALTVWTSIVVPILHSNTANIELAEAVTGLSWAIAKALGGKLPISQPTNEGGVGEHKIFMSLYNAATTDDLRTRCVGVLGCLGLAPGRIGVNKEIGVFLVSSLSALPPTGNTATDPAIEALNAVFDVYSDAEFDYDEPVFVKHNFLEHLKSILPKVQSMTKKIDKRRFPEQRARAEDATQNLRRFIEYKKKERS